MHLGEITGDASVSTLETLLHQVSGSREPTVQALVSGVLRYQGVKLASASQQVLTHGHRHSGTMMVGDMLHECTRRVQETVSSCFKQLGAVSVEDQERG